MESARTRKSVSTFRGYTSVLYIHVFHDRVGDVRRRQPEVANPAASFSSFVICAINRLPIHSKKIELQKTENLNIDLLTV